MIKVVDGRVQTTAGHAATVEGIRAWARPPLPRGEGWGEGRGEGPKREHWLAGKHWEAYPEGNFGLTPNA